MLTEPTKSDMRAELARSFGFKIMPHPDPLVKNGKFNWIQSGGFRLALVVAYWVVGFILTHIPLRGGEVALPHVDKIAHFALYAGLCLLMAFWLGQNRTTFRGALIAFAICVVYGVLDEGLQAFVPSRIASLADWVADVLGSIFGACLYCGLRNLFSSRLQR